MKYKNGKVSQGQIFAMIFTEFTGAGIMSATVLSRYMCGRDGLIAMTAVIVAAVLAAAAILNYCGGNAFEGKKLFWIIAALKYFLRLVMAMVLVIVFVKNNLLQNVNILCIILPLGVFLWYGMGLGFEGRARLSQITFWFILVALIIAAWKSIQGFNRYNISPLFTTGTGRGLWCTVVLFLLYTPVEMLFWCRDRIQGKGLNIGGSVIGAMILSGVTSLIFFIIEQGSNRQFLVKTDTVPVSALIFIVVSVIQLIMTYGYYVRKCIGKIKDASHCVNIYTAIAVTAVTVLICCTTFAGKYMTRMLGGANRVQSASGNVNNNIEQRSYVMIMGIDYDESEGFKVWINEANNSEAEYVKSWRGENLEMLQNGLKNISNSEVDFSNTKTLVLGTGIIQQKGVMQQVTEYFKDFNGFNYRCYVVVSAKSPEDIVTASAVQKVYRYEYISEMLNNNYKEYDVTLASVLGGLDGNARKSIKCMLFEAGEGELKNAGACVFNENGRYTILDPDTDILLDCMEGRTKGKVISSEDGQLYSVKYMDNNVNLDIINNETIGVHITVQGELEAMNQDGAYNSEDICEWIKYRLESSLRSMLIDEGIDYIQLYNRLSVEDRVMWIRYNGKEGELYRHAYFDVNCKVKIK